MLVNRILTVLLLVAVVLSGPVGCVGLLAGKPHVKLNPKYRSTDAPPLLPVLYAPVIGCPSARTNIEPARGARALTVDLLVPDMLESLGNREHPGFAPRNAHADLCQQFIIGNRYPSWEGNAVLRRSAEAALAGSDANAVLFLMLSMQYRCEKVYEDILARDGRTVIGRLDRGTRCYEDGTVLAVAALLTRAGEIAWHSGGKTDDKSLRDFSRDWPGPKPEPPAEEPPAPAPTVIRKTKPRAPAPIK